jgi:hypothetical protein
MRYLSGDNSRDSVLTSLYDVNTSTVFRKPNPYRLFLIPGNNWLRSEFQTCEATIFAAIALG